MGLFRKKEEKKIERNTSYVPENFPELPELPTLPGLPFQRETLPQLPSFPNNDLGTRFSQNTIKEAVTGKKEVEEVDADDFEDEDDLQMMQKPLKKPLTKNFEDEDNEEILIKRKTYEPKSFGKSKLTKKAEPVFIRLDKFEESIETFERIKNQISEIENLIKQTKDVKEKEEEELASWEIEIQSIKGEIEKINQDIFSKIE